MNPTGKPGTALLLFFIAPAAAAHNARKLADHGIFSSLLKSVIVLERATHETSMTAAAAPADVRGRWRE